ncbi:hypothetical protein D2T31_00570 [Sinirhodobacter populi]|uniref:GNAT family N-acetyltransferase n=1 Tax=Paenirhodobacter populi TaxID=2306993 RepID=A0A443KIA7_9RHOB|nr:hypothetical protein [Sinirhodobacter populi]RWR32511.1 hypothetical protein D2T31_00570 [Sinirhodobacter populi]
MITVRPYEDYAAHAVLSRLDPADLLEAEVTRGRATSALELFADWRAMNSARMESWVLVTGAGEPFALLGLVHTGQAGVAAAALLARDHRRFRWALAQAAVLIRRRLPEYAAETGVRRVEARAWGGHPTACDLLFSIGFDAEAIMHGFGPDGRDAFVQYAWIAPHIAACPDTQLKD